MPFPDTNFNNSTFYNEDPRNTTTFSGPPASLQSFNSSSDCNDAHSRCHRQVPIDL